MNYAVDEATAIVDQACQAIAKTEKGKLTDTERKEITSHVLAALPYLDHLKYTYPEREFPFKLYRVRAEKGIGEEETINQAATFSYPSPEKCETARANKKGCPVFYVADNPQTALKEAECKEGEIFFVTEWKLEEPMDNNFFLFFEHALPETHPWGKIHKQQDEQFKNIIAKASQANKEKWQQLHNAFCKAFLGEDYEISSIIGHQLLHANKKPDVQVLVYPSTVESDHYCNLAIHPDFADKHMHIQKAWKVKIVDEQLNKNPQIIEEGAIKNDTINWHKPKGNEDDNMLPLD